MTKTKPIIDIVFDELIARFDISGILRIPEHSQKSSIFDGYGFIHIQKQGGTEKLQTISGTSL